MTQIQKQILPALHNSGKISDPDLSYIGDRNYTATILKYANLAINLPQLETDAKTVVGAINECRVIANPEMPEEPESLTAIQIKDTVYTVAGGGSDVVPNPTGTPTDKLSTVGIDDVIYDVGASTLAGLNDTVISSRLYDDEYLVSEYSTNKWTNKSITDILCSTTKGSPCAFYVPLSANLLNCIINIVPNQAYTYSEGVPSPTNYQFIDVYTQTTIGITSSYYDYFSGLFKNYYKSGSCYFVDLSTLGWYYNDYYEIFTTSLDYDTPQPKYNFQGICTRYTYRGSQDNKDIADMSFGYRGYNGQSLWIRDDKFNGDVDAFKASLTGVHLIYESYYNDSIATISDFNMLVSEFNISGWAYQIAWTSVYSGNIYGLEYNPLAGNGYITWKDKSIVSATSGYTIDGDYVIYDTDDWEDLPALSANALCTNFQYETSTYTPSADHFSVIDGKFVFNISTILASGTDWSSWLDSKSYITLVYEIVQPEYVYFQSGIDISTFKFMNFMWSSSLGTVEAKYYGYHTAAYTNFVNIVNANTLSPVAMSGSYADLSSMPKINGVTLSGDKSTSDIKVWKDITGTLTAGSTTITLSDSSITTSSTIEPYTDTFGVSPTNITVVNGSVTLTFDTQSSDLGVKVRVS